MESKDTNSNSRIGNVLIAIGPFAIGIAAGIFYDAFISNERGWNFVLFLLPVILSYIPTFIAITDLQKRQGIGNRPRTLWAIALLITGIFGAAVYFGTYYGRTEKGSARMN